MPTLRVLAVVLGLLVLSACNGNLTIFPRDEAPQPPQAPTGLTATPEAGKVVLTWQDESDEETGYTVFRLETSGNVTQDFSKLVNLPRNYKRYEDTAITPGVKYRYAVQAENDEGSSPRALTGDEPVEAAPKPVTNMAPTALTQAVDAAAEDEAVTVTLRGSDANGDALTFATETQPGKGSLGSLDVNTGRVLYTPSTNATGTDTFSFTVSDGELTSEPAVILIDVGVVNDLPTITSSATTEITEGSVYSYTVTATDVDDDTLSFSATESPGWLTLMDNNDGSATLSGTPQAADVGVHDVILVVKDGSGGSAEQTFAVAVTALPTTVTSGAGSLR